MATRIANGARRLVRLLGAGLWLASALAAPARAATLDEAMAALVPYAGQTVTAITLDGNDVTRDWVIAREIWTEVGRPLDLATVREDLVRLENLAIFGSVVATAVPDAGGVALNYVFTEMPWIIPYPSVSYTEENGFSVGLGVASPNFLGRDVALSASVVTGGATTYKFTGENPWVGGNHVSLGVEASHQRRANELLDFSQTTDVAVVSAGTYLGRTGRLKLDAGFAGVGSDQPGITLSERNYDNLWHVRLTAGYDDRDSWRVPHQGWQNELALLYAGGDAGFVGVDIDIRRYQPLARRHTLATGPLLSLQSGMVDVEIPRYLQYFIGGANSVRGFELAELGKEMSGKHQLLYTLEYRYLLKPIHPVSIFSWSVGVGLELAAFGDLGVVWSRPEDLSLDRTRAGFGAGLRVLLPALEMVRFDVGVSQYGDVVFNFGVNSIFTARRQRAR